MIKPYYQDDWTTLYCADCRDVLPHLPRVDLVLTDPPYGIGADSGVGGFGSAPKTARKYKDKWDTRPNKTIFDCLVYMESKQIIFGGNYFTDLLPQNGHWIVWDKVGEIRFNNPFSDCELAWTNINKKSVKKYLVIQQGFIAEEKDRYHPTQKPVKLFYLILNDYSEKPDLILDPFAGSGTTLVAAKQLGRKSIGIEISKDYCDIIVKRLGQEVMNI